MSVITTKRWTAERLPSGAPVVKYKGRQICHAVGMQDATLIARTMEVHSDLLAACKCALERIEDGSMEQTNEQGQPTKHAESVSRDTVAWLRAAIAKGQKRRG